MRTGIPTLALILVEKTAAIKSMAKSRSKATFPLQCIMQFIIPEKARVGESCCPETELRAIMTFAGFHLEGFEER
jgi:hypothetical protein